MPVIGTEVGDGLRFLVNPGQAVRPIVGNTEQGGAAYDPGTGQATYGVYHDGKFRCFRTITTAESLALIDNSVEEVGVIWDKEFTLDTGSRKCCLTVIGGSLYATVSGAATDVGGTWIYKDTSGTSGEGPWTLYSTVHSVDTTSVTNSSLYGGIMHGTEVFVMASGRWIVGLLYYREGGGFGRTDWGMYYSDDQGGSWSPGCYTFQGGIGFDATTHNGVPAVRAVSVGSSSSSLGYLNGAIYAACSTNTGGESHWYTLDGASWTRYQIGVGGNSVYTFPFSVGTHGWRATRNESWAWTTGYPESSPTYNDAVNLGSYGLATASGPVRAAACNIGSNLLPLVAVSKLGKILGLGQFQGGWTVGYIGIA